MENITLRVEGRKLIAEIDLDVEVGLSKTGKSVTVATTSGNHPISELIDYDGPEVVGINVYRKP